MSTVDTGGPEGDGGLQSHCWRSWTWDSNLVVWFQASMFSYHLLLPISRDVPSGLVVIRRPTYHLQVVRRTQP